MSVGISISIFLYGLYIYNMSCGQASEVLFLKVCSSLVTLEPQYNLRVFGNVKQN